MLHHPGKTLAELVDEGVSPIIVPPRGGEMEPELLSKDNCPGVDELVLVWSYSEGIGLARLCVGYSGYPFEWAHKRVCGERMVGDVVFWARVPDAPWGRV